MVDEISPAYYAWKDVAEFYELHGRGFNLIPDDAVGLFATDVNAPLDYGKYDGDKFLFSIIEKTDTMMRLQARQPSTHGSDNFLGGILSADKSQVYWVNNTRPLP